jgi:hypothetical protein
VADTVKKNISETSTSSQVLTYMAEFHKFHTPTIVIGALDEILTSVTVKMVATLLASSYSTVSGYVQLWCKLELPF